MNPLNKKILITTAFHHIILLTSFFFILFLIGPLESKSFLLGSLIAFIDAGSYYILASAILFKKYIALAIPIIVFKYPILFYLLYILVIKIHFSVLWLMLGVFQIVATILFFALISKNTEY